jgi:tRNA (guanine26-N2/guanine27-N2)-dimethyltransferase
VQQRAASEGWGLDPIFSYFTGENYRLLVRMRDRSALNDINYGFLGYCHHCGEYQTINRQYLHRTTCPACEQSPLVLSGMLWLGKLHDRSFLEAMRSLAQTWQWDKITNLLTLMTEEIDFPPYHYTLGEIGRRGKLDIPKRSQLIDRLQQAGYRAVETHINPQAIKTNAKLADCIAIARQHSSA